MVRARDIGVGRSLGRLLPIRLPPALMISNENALLLRLSRLSEVRGSSRNSLASSLTIKGAVMAIGVVKWFNATKGYGFIQPQDGGNDVFVHISAVERAGLSSLAEGQEVSFELKTDPRRGKTSAENLRV